MIPRTGRRLHSTTCRFLNPTKRRCYSTPTKKVNASATMNATASASHDMGMSIPPFGLSQGQVAAQDGAHATSNSLEESPIDVLYRPVPLTLIPQPVQPVQGNVTSSLRVSLPKGGSSLTAFEDAAQTSMTWYTNSKTLDMTAIIDACLHNLYDVQRAQEVFKRLRSQLAPMALLSSSTEAEGPKPPSVLTTPLYNSFIEAYVGMAEKDEFQRERWLHEAWTLYHTLDSGAEGVRPNAKTYALIMGLWWKLESRAIFLDEPIQSASSSSYNGPPLPGQILSSMTIRNIPVMSVVSHPCLDSPEVMAQIAKALSAEAVKLGLKSVLEEMGEAIGTVQGQEVLAEMHGGDMLNMEEVPQVRPVLKEVKRKDVASSLEAPTHITPPSLESLRNTLNRILALRKVLPANTASDLYTRQRHLESSVYEMAEERKQVEARIWKDAGLDDGLQNVARDSQLKAWIWDWHCLLTERIRKELKHITDPPVAAAEGKKKRKKGKQTAPPPAPTVHKSLAPYLGLIPPQVMSLLTILEILQLQGTGGIVGGMKTTRALIGVGKAVEEEWRERGGGTRRTSHESISEGSTAVEGEVAESDCSMDSASLPTNNSEERRDGERWTSPWSQVTRSQIGAVLVEMLMDIAKVERVGQDESGKVVSETQAALYHSYEFVRGTKLGILLLNPIVLERLAKDDLSRTIHPRHLPMLVRPRSWTGVRDGAYLKPGAVAMRFKTSLEQELYLREATAAGNCSLVYAGLDILGSTPWRVNRGVFETVLRVWNEGFRMGKLPPAEYDQPEPVLELSQGVDDVTALEQKRDWMIKHRQWSQSKANNHSDRCNVNYKIEIARTFLNDVFYLPHNVDFRGRAYPIPPHLNHIGDDLSRGLLKFADAKPLGERGLRWLKIHTAGLYGFDKAKFDERVKWVDDRMDEIRDSATNPLDGTRWWTKADDPWQCLAACMELQAAYDLPDPTTYESSLPIHQDGTCNGLQHYAALGGDATGAAQVNLAVSDRPSDVYTHVSSNVEKLITEDLELANVPGGLDSLSEQKRLMYEFAKMLTGKISRKVVKQTVMTTVYGVTFVGARDQIERQLKDLAAKLKLSGDESLKQEKMWGLASYLARKVLLSIGETFSGAKGIQTWLNICARLISKSIPPSRLLISRDEDGRELVNLPKYQIKKEQMTSVVWTTPLGLPIVQPYRKVVRKQVKTRLQSVYISDPNAPSEVDAVKQVSAFPPNFIHSLDATHMMLTALECRNQDLTFASVHDSYWTHGADVDKMSIIIRDTFIALHSSDVLKKLDREFRQRYKGYKVPLDNISGTSTTLIKQLSAAGTRIKVPRRHGEAFKSLSDIIELTDDEEATEHITYSKLEEEDVDVAGTADDENLLSAIGEGEHGYEDGGEKVATSKKRTVAENSKVLAGKYIEITDLLPPLPDKGTFNVETIKKSQYFFS